jgi:ferredoxin
MSAPRLVIDPIACESHGLCAELLPELIELDEWGDPLVRSAVVPIPLERLAVRAVGVCPTLALRIARSARER